jgi:hypothetical protein
MTSRREWEWKNMKFEEIDIQHTSNQLVALHLSAKHRLDHDKQDIDKVLEYVILGSFNEGRHYLMLKEKEKYQKKIVD